MVKLQYLYSVSLIYLWSLVAKNLVFLFKLHYKTSHSACNDLFFSSLALQKMSATLTIPEKSSQEIKLVYKFLQSKVETTTGKDLLLEVQQTMSLKGKKKQITTIRSLEKKLTHLMLLSSILLLKPISLNCLAIIMKNKLRYCCFQ